MRTTSSNFLLTTLTLTAGLCGQDRQAAFAPSLNPTTTSPSQAPVRIHGGAPPLLGQFTSITVTAPGYSTGMMILSSGAGAGLSLPYLGTTLDLYVDPLLFLGTFPLPISNGMGSLALPIPPSPLLTGLDLAWQAVLVTPTGQAGASNLLSMNLGDSLTGGAAFAFAFTKPIAANSYAMDNGHPAQKLAIYCNETAGPLNVTISGQKQSDKGPLELRDGNGKVLSQIARSGDSFSKTITVPPGTCVYLFNTDTNGGVTVSWDVAVK